MPPNTFGEEFRLTTWGESHGPAVGCVLDGCPAGLEIALEVIQKELDKRRPGGGGVSTPRREKDKVEILSGVFEGKTLGTPVSLLIENRDADSSPYEKLKDKPRPGHADYAWRAKFGLRDWRGGGRASARETAGRVAGGAIAKRLLSSVLGLRVVACAREIGGVESEGLAGWDADKAEKRIYSNAVRALDPKAAKTMEKAVEEAKADGDSLGGIIECAALNAPAGLGEPVFDKLTAELARAVMSIPAVRGVEFGIGFEAARKRGSQVNDELEARGKRIVTKTNNAGGINGGISNGMPIILRAAVKPTSSIGREQRTVDLKKGGSAKIRIGGRHDPCVVPRAVPVVEAMAALALADHGIRSGSIPRTLA